MSRGNWTSRAFFWTNGPRSMQRKRSAGYSPARRAGSTGLLSILVGNFLGHGAPAHNLRGRGQDTQSSRSRKIIDGAVHRPIRGKDRDSDTVISNSEYWIAPEIMVAKSDKSRMRAFGRNWNFGRGGLPKSAKLDWRGP